MLDLFAGSGALGIEALSRGAAQRHVRRARAAARWPRCARTSRALGLERALARASPATRSPRCARAAAQYDLVFLDPPYAVAATLAGALSRELPPVLAAGARVVSESDRRAPLELELPARRERRYGDTLIRIHELR